MMKKILIVLALGLFGCHGNESAESKPTDLDRTNNNDTNVKPDINKDSNTISLDSLDSIHKKKEK